MPLDQSDALEVLNILGPFNGRRIRADVVRNNLNARKVRALTESQFDDLVRELKTRDWISKRVDDFGNPILGITEEGQLVREKNNQ